MSILLRPGWAHRVIYHPADQQRLIAEARAINVVRQAEAQFLKALQSSGQSMEFFGTPHTEIYRFVGRIILDNPELAKYFPDVRKPYQLKSRHIARLATIEGGDKSIEKLQAEINATFSDMEKFKEIARSLAAERRAKGTSEVKDMGVEDKREKHRHWSRKLGPKEEPVATVKASELSPEELGAVEGAEFRARIPAIMSKLRVSTGESFMELANDYPQLSDAIERSSSIDDVLTNLIDLVDSDDEGLAAAATDVYRATKRELLRGGAVSKESVKLTAKQTDHLLQERHIKTRQYLAAIEEQFGR